jgi:hypothetical protein
MEARILSARTGYVRPYEVTAEAMRKIKRLNLDKLNKILMKPEERRRTFENILLTAARTILDFWCHYIITSSSSSRLLFRCIV